MIYIRQIGQKYQMYHDLDQIDRRERDRDIDKIERTDRRIDHDIGQMDRKVDQENYDLDQIARSD